MDASFPGVQSGRPMKTIACLAAALAASVGLGCRGSDPRPGASDPPTTAPAAPAPAAPPAPAPAASAPAPSPDPAPTAPADPAPGAPPKAYAGDIQKLCDVVRLSGAETESPDDRRLPIATWLAANLTTAESRQFLARIQPLGGVDKADALDAEARRVGLAGCALAAEWRAPPTR
jgi:hypothetical protein